MKHIVAIVVLGIACNGEEAKQTKPAQVAPAKPPEPDAGVVVVPDAAPIAPPIEVTAKQLFADYEANEVAADGKYRGKALMVTGIVKKISKDVLDNAHLYLSVGDQYGINEVMADFTDESVLGKLKKGQKIVARCVGKGMTLTMPTVGGCSAEHIYTWVPK